MINSITGKLTVIDLRNVFWNGAPVSGVASVFIHADEDSSLVKLEVLNGDEQQLAELEAAGVRVRRLK